MLQDKLPTWVYFKALMLGTVTLLVLAAGCTQLSSLHNDREAEPIAVAQLPAFSLDDLYGLDHAIQMQCALASPPAPWRKLCVEFQALTRGSQAQTSHSLRHWLTTRFAAFPLRSDSGNAQGLITGYYEPMLTGSRKRESETQVPLYKRPADLAKNMAYATRAEIQNSSLLAGQELMWIDDPVDAFFLEVQGSGRVQLRSESGTTTARIGFADHNGQPYKAIGRVLIEQGSLTPDGTNAESIKAWLRANPAQGKLVMQANPRYIFFKELNNMNADKGPLGSLAVPLTAQRSIATDPKSVPPGSLMYLDTTMPDNHERRLSRVVVSQDVGAAITGTVRADLFWGFGADAERKASLMKQQGRLWLLVPL